MPKIGYVSIVANVKADTKNMHLLCTDGESLGEILKNGSIDHVVSIAIKSGVDPLMRSSSGDPDGDIKLCGTLQNRP